MSNENINIWCWIIPALVGIIAGILGYLIGKGKDAASIDHSSETKVLEAENEKLKSELKACLEKQSDSPAQDTEGVPVAKLDHGGEQQSPFNAKAAKAALGRRVKENDLKIVEGIGPKIEGLFHNFNIKTWKDLSEVSTVKCQEVLNSGGKRYRIHDPASWPMQAKMAYQGQWKELAKWQDKHKSGKF
nr:hypothetical protein [Allomuricauda sp.]